MTIIPQGYKETEIGVLPDQWNIAKIEDLFTFKNGLNKAKEFFGYGIPIVNYMDVYANRFINQNNLKGRVHLNNQEIKNFEIQKGDVFFTRTSETQDEIGIASVLDTEPKCPIVFSGFLLRARPKNDLLLSNYLGYAFLSNQIRKSIISTSSYTTRALTNGRLLSNLLIPIPPLPEQTAIADALRDIDDLINTTQALVAKKKAIKTATMQQLLTPKEDWVEMTLGDRCSFFSGGTPNTSIQEYYNGYIPFITSSDLNKTYISYVPNNISQNGLNNSSAKVVNEGTVLVALYGATAGITAITYIKGAINQAVLAILPKYDLEKFIYFQLTYLKNWIVGTFIQGGQGNLNASTFKDLILKFPNTSYQKEIVDILDTLVEEIEHLESTLFKYQSIKQGMMQNLLTGKIRLI